MNRPSAMPILDVVPTPLTRDAGIGRRACEPKGSEFRAAFPAVRRRRGLLLNEREKEGGVIYRASAVADMQASPRHVRLPCARLVPVLAGGAKVPC